MDAATLKNKSVCIVGCGGLGCNVAVHIVGFGVGNVILCDFDTVNESNLNRQFLYTKDDIGKSKAQKSKDFLSSYKPNCKITVENKKILNVKDLLFADKCDVIISAVDNGETRKVLTDFCTNKNIPLICGVIEGNYGLAYLYIPNKTACPECAGMCENVLSNISVSSTAGIIGAYQAHLVQKYLLTKNAKIGGNLFVFDDGETHLLKIMPSGECKICKKHIDSEVVK